MSHAFGQEKSLGPELTTLLAQFYISTTELLRRVTMVAPLAAKWDVVACRGSCTLAPNVRSFAPPTLIYTYLTNGWSREPSYIWVPVDPKNWRERTIGVYVTNMSPDWSNCSVILESSHITEQEMLLGP